MDKTLDFNKQQRGYLIAYIPFKAKLNQCKKGNNFIEPSKLNTKLMIKSVTNVISDKIANYNIYKAQTSKEEIEEVERLVEGRWLSSDYLDYIKKYNTKNEVILTFNDKQCANNQTKTNITIKNIENVFRKHIGTFTLKDLKEGKCSEEELCLKDASKVNEDNSDIKIDNVDVSIYDDGDAAKLGFLKIRIRIDYKRNCTYNEQVQALRDVYDVLSRNIKGKAKSEEKTENKENLYLGFDYENLCEGIANYCFKGLDNNTFCLNIEKDNILFNYSEKDKRCYVFAYITMDRNIDDYTSEWSTKNYEEPKQLLYSLSRIHENGAIRTYNKKNEIFDYYMDDTSTIWGISRVGLGALSVQSEREELYRNIKVFNTDFSFLYEFALHQKFYYYLMSLQDESIKTTIEEKEKLFAYIKTFCPKIVSEFETQEIYDSIRKKLEIEKLLEDANSSISALEAKDEVKRKSLLTKVSSFIFAIGFPIAVYEYISNMSEINEALKKININILNSPIVRIIAAAMFVIIVYVVVLSYRKKTDSKK